MITLRRYRGMKDFKASKHLNFRYNLEPHDMQTLYRKLGRLNGVDITKLPQYNLDDWLDEASPNFKPDLKKSIFAYSPRAERGERLEVCIATQEMDEAAWKYTHSKQLILDGTFGVVSSRMLLWIALGVDEHGKGVPLAFFLFSAPTGSRATHAGYNTAILLKLLTCWRDHLGIRNGVTFAPLVAITDTDTRERGALLSLWKSIWLLICKFHLRQCWTNKRKTLLKGDNFWMLHVRERMHILEQRYDFTEFWLYLS